MGEQAPPCPRARGGGVDDRHGLSELSGGGDPDPESVYAKAEARWAWESRCVVGRRSPAGAVDVRAVKGPCSAVRAPDLFAH